jgi:putative cryptic C4-dicarboxylate transporter dcuD
VVAVSGMAKISPFEIVKRMSVPMIVGFICVIITTEFFIPAV